MLPLLLLSCSRCEGRIQPCANSLLVCFSGRAINVRKVPANCTWIIFKKELRSYFVSPVAYLLLAMFAVVFGFFFWNILGFFIYRGMESQMDLFGEPERRFFQTNEQSGTMVAIYSTLREDLYVVYAGENPETRQPVIHAYLNPLVKWIWLGGLVVVLGTLVTLLPNRRAVLVLAGAPQGARLQQPSAQTLAPSVALREGHD